MNGEVSLQVDRFTVVLIDRDFSQINIHLNKTKASIDFSTGIQYLYI